MPPPLVLIDCCIDRMQAYGGGVSKRIFITGHSTQKSNVCSWFMIIFPVLLSVIPTPLAPKQPVAEPAAF